MEGVSGHIDRNARSCASLCAIEGPQVGEFWCHWPKQLREVALECASRKSGVLAAPGSQRFSPSLALSSGVNGLLMDLMAGTVLAFARVLIWTWRRLGS